MRPVTPRALLPFKAGGLGRHTVVVINTYGPLGYYYTRRQGTQRG